MFPLVTISVNAKECYIIPKTEGTAIICVNNEKYYESFDLFIKEELSNDDTGLLIENVPYLELFEIVGGRNLFEIFKYFRFVFDMKRIIDLITRNGWMLDDLRIYIQHLIVSYQIELCYSTNDIKLKLEETLSILQTKEIKQLAFASKYKDFKAIINNIGSIVAGYQLCIKEQRIIIYCEDINESPCEINSFEKGNGYTIQVSIEYNPMSQLEEKCLKIDV